MSTEQQAIIDNINMSTTIQKSAGSSNWDPIPSGQRNLAVYHSYRLRCVYGNANDFPLKVRIVFKRKTWNDNRVVFKPGNYGEATVDEHEQTISANSYSTRYCYFKIENAPIPKYDIIKVELTFIGIFREFTVPRNPAGLVIQPGVIPIRTHKSKKKSKTKKKSKVKKNTKAQKKSKTKKKTSKRKRLG